MGVRPEPLAQGRVRLSRLRHQDVAINGAETAGGPAIGAQFGLQQKMNEVKAELNWRFAPNLW
jgi:hypothetical protein